MKNEISFEEKKYSECIFQMRHEGNFSEAVSICDKAIAEYSQNNFFYKIKGDILFSIEDYNEAIKCYMDYLIRIKSSPEFFTNFANFFRKISNVYNMDVSIYHKILKMSRDSSFPHVIRKGLLKIICDYWPASDEIREMIERVNSDFSKEKVKEAFLVLKAKGECDRIYFLSRLNVDNCVRENSQVNKQILKEMEAVRIYEYAIKWILKMLEYSNDGVLVRALFRICRKRKDYSEAKQYMLKKDISENADFNIRYELVLFYEAQEDEENRNKTLKEIDNIYRESIPIAQTLFNFYVRYDMIENAKAIEKRINKLKARQILGDKTREKYEKASQENQKLMLKRLNDLLEEQEHNRQLLAITELIKGFSHELGQPITNIRYSIQLFYMKNAKNHVEVCEEEKELLDGILLQTGRVGKLLDRFAPIISSKSTKEFFCVYDEISVIFEELKMRLNNEGIKYTIQGNKAIKLYGETLQFSQIFYNLIINSIYAIKKKNIAGEIQVNIKENDKKLIISFVDNGIGIPKDIQRKIFDPFYSTKRKEVEEGGEGLGLYIVWNILKMFRGKIYVDPDYLEGAMFIIEIQMEEEKIV